MTRKELRESVERYLQGKRNERWSDSEINSYLDEAQLEFCRLSKIPETEFSSTIYNFSSASVAPSPTPVAGVVSASGRTVSLTSAVALTTLAVNDSVLVDGSDNTNFDGGHVVTKIVKSTSAITITLSSDIIDVGEDTIASTGHPLSDGDKVELTISSGVGDVLPTGLSSGVAYYVVNKETDKFKVSTTEGGSAVDIGAVGQGTMTVGASTFEYLLPENVTQTSTGMAVTYVETGPVISKPSTILEVTGVTLNGRELAFYTQSDLDRAAHSYGGGRIMDTVLGPTMSPFNSVGMVTSPKSWRDVDGKPEAVVMSERSASSFRVFPLPSLPEHIYVEKDATTKVSLSLIIKGVIKPTTLSADTSTPDIPESYHEALIYGALDRAYMKESQLRNVDKSNMFRGRFLGLVDEAKRNEGLNSGSLGGGRNEIRIRVSR